MRPAELESLKYYELTRCYRSTPQILRYASAFLPEANGAEAIDREGDPVETGTFASEAELDGALCESLAAMRKKGCERIALLCKTASEAERIGAALRRRGEVFDMVRSERDTMNGELAVIPVYFAKGLEFDGVILVQYKDAEWDSWISYVLSTRALHRLTHLKEV